MTQAARARVDLPERAKASAYILERERATLIAHMAKDGPGRVVRRVETRRGKERVRWRLDFGRSIEPRYLDSYNGAPMETEELANAFLILVRHAVAHGKGRPLQDVIDEVGPRGGDGPAIEPLLEEWVTRFRRKVEAGDRSKNTLDELERWATPGTSGHLTWWFGASLYTVDKSSLEEWDYWMATEQGLGAKTRRNVMAAMHTFCVWARERRPAFEIPDFPWPEHDVHVPRVISLDLQQQVLEAIPEDRRGAFIACARLGLRPNEARVVRVSDWRGDELHVHRGQKDNRVMGREGGTKKRRGGRRLPIPADLRAWLEAHVKAERRLDGDALLFQNPGAYNDRKQWSESAMRRAWWLACEAVGVEISLYEGTKHSLGAAAKEAGVEDRVLATIFGHSDMKSVQPYTPLSKVVVKTALGRIRPSGKA